MLMLQLYDTFSTHKENPYVWKERDTYVILFPNVIHNIHKLINTFVLLKKTIGFINSAV